MGSFGPHVDKNRESRPTPKFSPPQGASKLGPIRSPGSLSVENLARAVGFVLSTDLLDTGSLISGTKRLHVWKIRLGFTSRFGTPGFHKTCYPELSSTQVSSQQYQTVTFYNYHIS
jgi:hypothetical protein